MADELDEHLIPKNSPYNTREPYVTAYDFDVTHQIPAGGINYTNLTAASRAATAIISLSGEKGTFKDIQAAINYVNGLGGGRILVLPGTYTISQNIMLYSDIHLEGLSVADCIFDFGNSTNNVSLTTNSTNVKVSSLTFRNCQNTTTGVINLTSVSFVEIINCLFTANISTGYDIYASTVTSLKIRDCVSNASGGFFSCNIVSGLGEVANNRIVDPSGYVFFGGATNTTGSIVCRGNIVYTPTKSIIYGKFASSNFTDNIFSFTSVETETAIVLTYAAEVAFTGNSLDNLGSSQAGLSLTNGTRVRFIGNDIGGDKDNTPVILLTDCVQCTFSGNFISGRTTGASQDGIKLVNGDQIVITGNFIRGSTTAGTGTSYGVNISDAASAVNVVVGNYLQGRTSPYNDAGTGDVVANNMT